MNANEDIANENSGDEPDVGNLFASQLSTEAGIREPQNKENKIMKEKGEQWKGDGLPRALHQIFCICPDRIWNRYVSFNMTGLSNANLAVPHTQLHLLLPVLFPDIQLPALAAINPEELRKIARKCV
ncbi:hypothetical protein GWI33_020523 [Rhynchophorus ferrugineus]|uniref:Uncharacterized protein n=1 Tax=Rhynchophorus ferrugineus TaxID=354439 RepID=A0A834HQY8_RHYFE|nr:hypothetical protein GWI33_020523 [Rhynchophorus ferrugineus]